MNTGFLGLLLAQVVFSWTPSQPEDSVTSYQLEQTDTAGDYSQALVVNMGLPPTVNGRKEFTYMIDRSSVKYFVLKAKNSWGVSPPSNEVRMGPPSGFQSVTVMPAPAQ